MLTPLDLEKIQFGSHLLGGYKKEEVEEAFTMLRHDYEELYYENISLKDKLEMLDDLCKKYKAMEDTLQSSIIIAQSTGEQVKQNAAEKAALMIRDAEIRSTEIVNQTNSEIAAMQKRLEEVKLATAQFAARSIGLLQAQIEIVKEMARDAE